MFILIHHHFALDAHSPLPYKAKETYLRVCRKTPSSQTWRGVGVACYHLNDLPQAEDTLCEANILNNLDSTVWAYLTLVCLKVQT